MTYMAWRRKRAVSESRALRGLARAGKRCAPTGDLWRDWSYYERRQGDT